MNGILLAIIAHALLGVSLVIDKTLLRRRVVGSSITYVFWIGISNGVLLLLALYRFTVPDLATAALGILTGLLLLTASRFYFGALSRGEATQAPTVVGAFTPIATAIWSAAFLNLPLTVADKTAFVILVAGGFIMFFCEHCRHRQILPWVIVAAAFYGIGNVVQKIVFSRIDIPTALALYAAGMFVGAFTLLLRPEWRAQIFSRSEAAPAGKRGLYFANRLLAGAGVLLVFLAIKFEHPALVDAVAGARAVVVFLLVALLAKLKPRLLTEHMAGRELAGKVIATTLIIIGLLGLGLQRYYERFPVPAAGDVRWGITFSDLMARRLGLDPQETLRATIRDLRPAGLRFVAYWDAVEPRDDAFDFSSVDWQMSMARDAGIPVILAVGQKAPRWPECHFPAWLDTDDRMMREEQLLAYVRATLERYRDDPVLAMWQIENEPFLLFGQCPLPRTETIDRELRLASELDPRHQILMTDGGEFGDWYRAAKRGDAFGTTLYRKVYNRVLGYITYPLTPEFYPLKRDVIRWMTKRQDQPWLVTELGLEPWGKRQIHELTPDEQRALFSPQDFEETVAYARAARFDTQYLWGAEWWYFLKERAGDSRYWELARTLMNPNP